MESDGVVWSLLKDYTFFSPVSNLQPPAPAISNKRQPVSSTYAMNTTKCVSAGVVPEAFLYETLENRGIHCYNSILWKFVNPGTRISVLICQGSSRHVEESLPLSSGDKQKVTEINRTYTMELELDIIDYAVNSSLICITHY